MKKVLRISVYILVIVCLILCVYQVALRIHAHNIYNKDDIEIKSTDFFFQN